jgi:hypothetical protein
LGVEIRVNARRHVEASRPIARPLPAHSLA